MGNLSEGQARGAEEQGKQDGWVEVPTAKGDRAGVRKRVYVQIKANDLAMRVKKTTGVEGVAQSGLSSVTNLYSTRTDSKEGKRLIEILATAEGVAAEIRERAVRILREIELAQG